jgi:hypothetical protein
MCARKAARFVVEPRCLQLCALIRNADEHIHIRILQSSTHEVGWRQTAERRRRTVVLRNVVLGGKRQHANAKCVQQITMLLAQSIEFHIGAYTLIRHLVADLLSRLGAFFQNRDTGDPLENAPACVYALEMLGIGQLRFGFAQEKNPTRLQRIMQPGQNLFLQLRIEINQYVAADEQVDVRDGRVLAEIAAQK